MAEIQRKQTRYMTRAEFNALDKTTVPVGTEINIVDQIQKEDLSTDLQNAVTRAENAIPSSGGTVSGDLTVTGNLTVSGTAITSKSWHDTAPADTSTVDFTRLKVLTVPAPGESATDYSFLVGKECMTAGYTDGVNGVWYASYDKVVYGYVSYDSTQGEVGVSLAYSDGTALSDAVFPGTAKLQFYY